MSGDLNEAYSRVNQLLNLQPEHENGQLLKVHILSQLWRDNPLYISSAVTFFKDRVLNNPEDMFVRGELYLIYNSEGYKDDARHILEDTVNRNNAPPQALYHYAMLLKEEQKFMWLFRMWERNAFEAGEQAPASALGIRHRVRSYHSAPNVPPSAQSK